VTNIRRIYAYLLAGAGLAMFAVAAANLLQVLIDVVFQLPLTTTTSYVRDSVSRYAAVALVGLPVWLVHWRWAERWLADPEERASTLRRLYLYSVLAASALVVANSLHESLIGALGSLLGTDPTPAAASWLDPLAFTLAGALVWSLHWRIADRDRGVVGEVGASATLRRWYLYGLALVGLAMLLSGAQGLLEALWEIAAASNPIGSPALLVAAPASSALVGLGLWLAHWMLLPGRLPQGVRRDDGVSTLRSVYLFLALTVSVAGSLLGLSQLLYYAVGRLLGIEHPGGIGGSLIEAAAGPASIAIVYGVAWAYQRNALRRQAAAFEEAPRQAGVRRLYTYLVSLVALVVLATGAAGLLWTLGDLILNTPAAASGEGWRGEAALFSTLAIVGLPVWLLHWRAVPSDPAEVRSLARRLYLYLSLIGAMLTVLGSVAAALYRLISIVLGEAASVDVLADLAHAFALAIVAGAIAAYHWRILRADARRAPSPRAADQQAVAVSTHALVEIEAEDPATLERALDALRAMGVRVTPLPAA
jgi:hypothetical protein